MPMLDLSDEDAELLQLAKRAGGASALDLHSRAYSLHQKLMNSAKHTDAYQDIIKAEVPDARVPKDVAAPYVARLDETNKRLDELLAEREKERAAAAEAAAQGDFNSKWSSVVKEYELTAEGEEKLLNFMKDRKNSDPEAAAALYYKQNPTPAAPISPTSIAPASWAKDMGIAHAEDDASSKALIANPESWADTEAAAVLTEIRRSGAAA